MEEWKVVEDEEEEFDLEEGYIQQQGPPLCDNHNKNKGRLDLEPLLEHQKPLVIKGRCLEPQLLEEVQDKDSVSDEEEEEVVEEEVSCCCCT